MSIEEKNAHIGSGEKSISIGSAELEKTISKEYVGFLDEFHKQTLYDILGHGSALSDKDDKNEEAEYLFQKIDELPVSRSIEILNKVIEDHDDDPNFPEADYDLIKELVKGPEANPEMSKEDWVFKTKLQAGLNEYFSPYPEVRAISSPIDDPTVPIETIRAYFLGVIWTIIGTGVNEFFSHRQPSITLSSSVIQMLLFPCGKFLQYVLPDWGFTFRGTRHSLNPGPWSYKEQMFTTIMFNVAIGSIYVTSNIMVQKLKVYYGNDWVSTGYQVTLAIATQMLGFGLAGVLRKVAIYPVRALWPTLLPTLALNQALLKPERKEVIHGWKISRYNFFLIVSGISFLYFWFPNYIFQALSTFNWMTWIKPQNFNLAMITGSVGGLGLNPIATFDWNIISYTAPLSVPFFSLFNQFIGTLIGFFCIAGIYYSNYKWTAYFPINDNSIFDNTANTYAVRQILSNGTLDESKYKQYGPPYYSAGNLIVYGAFFAIYPFSFVYTCFIERKSIWSSLKSMKSSFSIKSIHKSNFEFYKDPHSRMMAKYKEVPDWWFFVILLISIVFAIVCVKCYPANTPVWGIFFTIAINFVFLIPLTIIYAVTGFSFGLNVLVELIIGYALPGNGDALMTLKAFGYNIGGQAENYISDQKMAHYAKIPPRALFRGQMFGTVLQIIVALCVVNWSMSNVENICTKKQSNKFSCPGETTFYSASVFWGVIGPKKVFNQLYPILKWCFLIGFLLALVCIALKIFFPKQTRLFQPTLIIGGFLNWAPYNLSYIIPGLYAGWVFNYYIKKRYLAWWEKYNYVLASALTASVAFSAVIIFFSVQYHPKNINWWGNNVMYEGVDGGNGQISLKDPASAPDGYVGVRFGDFT